MDSETGPVSSTVFMCPQFEALETGYGASASQIAAAVGRSGAQGMYPADDAGVLGDPPPLGPAG